MPLLFPARSTKQEIERLSDTEMQDTQTQHIVAGESAILAKRYASALYEFAEEKNCLDEVVKDLSILMESIKDNADFRRVVSNPRLTRTQLAGIAENVARELKLGDTVISFLKLLARKRRLSHLDDIVGVFMGEVARQRGEKVVEVFAPIKFSDEQKRKLSENLEKNIGGKIRLLIKEDASLIGGLIIKWGSRFLDASIKGKLARIERQLKNQQEAA